MRIRRLASHVLPVTAVLSLLSGLVPAQEPPALPQKFRATIMVVNAAVSGSGRLAVTIDRWTTDEERKTCLEALKSGGTDALVAAMEKMTVGYLQVNSELRYPIRLASTWTTDKGQMVRVATNRPIAYGELSKGSRTMDYPIGFAEFAVPQEGRGEGSLVLAAQAGFDEKGRIEVTTLPSNTGAQRLTNVERDVPKKKKDKSKS